jgi:hypothetical protein
MKTGRIAGKTAYVGAGAGLALFAMIGLLPGSFLGGVFGIKIAGGLFGLPLKSDFLPRLTVGVSMILGILASGIFFIASGTMTGWIVGKAIDVLRTTNLTRAYFTGRKKTDRDKKSATTQGTKP